MQAVLHEDYILTKTIPTEEDMLEFSFFSNGFSAEAMIIKVSGLDIYLAGKIVGSLMTLSIYWPDNTSSSHQWKELS